ncbi:MAG TPA: 2Fe-2S iron-sulfur cluster-binding protein [Pararobbsia sp.]|nr:2Fe-2S iron-sulfur cluster-binding protein [Pararobbsia sp.]
MPKSTPTFVVRIEPAGWSFPAPADRPVMQAAREAGYLLPASCRNGTCRTCMCKLVSGTVRYTIEWPGIATDESDDGWILPCVAAAESPLVLHVPHTRLKSELDAILAQSITRSRRF